VSKRIALIGGTLFWVSVALAQPYLSVGVGGNEGGRFQVDQIKGCAPLDITLTNLLGGNCIPSNPCSIDYEDNKQTTQTQFTHRYQNPGVYKLTVLYQGQGANEITITVVENIKPAFEIYSCANADVTIKVLEKKYQQLVIDFNDGSPEVFIPSGNNATAFHDYASPGNKSIAVRGLNLNSADNCDSNVQPFNAVANLTPTKINSLTTLDASSISLEFTPQTHIQHRLEIAVNNASNFQLLKTLYDSSRFTATNLKTTENYYCFRLSSYDACNGQNNYSNTVCSQQFTLNIENAVNELNWLTSNTGIQSVEVERDNETLTVIPGTPNSFDDIDIECKTNYCYRIISRYAGGATSRSLQFCGESFKIVSVPPITNISTTASSDGLSLEWIQDPGSNPTTYDVLLSVDDQNFGPLGTSKTKKFQDVNYVTESTFSYRINYTDECDNKSPDGVIANPIRLTGSIENNIITLHWNEYKGWLNGIDRYVVDKYDLDGKLIRSINVTTNLVHVDDEADPDNQFIAYRIRAIPTQNGISNSVSNQISFIKDSKIFFPTAFSPNGDKLNDTFFVSGQFLVKLELSIFNRWGELIFVSSKNGEAWDGTYNGKPAAEGAYVWSAEITDRAGNTFKESGTVALLRKGR